MELAFNILWTLAVAGLTMLAEVAAAKFVLMKSKLSSISKDLDSDQANDAVIEKVRDHLHPHSRRLALPCCRLRFILSRCRWLVDEFSHGI